MPSAPIGWLELNGSTFDSSKYSALYSLLNTNKLPDFRECVLVGAGQSSNNYDASTNPSGIHEHDVYTLGQFKDDQFQGHRHNYYGGTHGNYGSYVRFEDSAGGPNNLYPGTPIADIESNGDPRYGTTTHGKQVGVLYCIKAL